MTAAPQLSELLVCLVFDQLQQFGVLPEEFLADVCATACLEVLIFAVNALFHALQKQSAGIAREQLIPIAAPEELDHVPARPAEDAFHLPNDAAVASHRS